MLMNELGKRSRIWLYLVPVGTLALVISGSMLLRRYNESLAAGLLWGGLGGEALAVVLQVLGRRRRGGGAARIAVGQADERDRRIVQQAAAVAGFVTILVLAIVAVVASIRPFGAEAALAIPLWSYLVALPVAYVVVARRS